MKQIYECEICGTQYQFPIFATFCESQMPPECLVQPGDTVLCYRRYEPKAETTVVGISLGKSYLAGILQNYCIWGKQGLDKFVVDMSRPPHNFYCTHEYVITLETEFQIGKDCWTCQVPLHCLYPISNPEVNFEEIMNERLAQTSV